MTKLQNLVRRFKGDESGATAIEYSLIAAGVGVAIVAGTQALGTQIASTLQQVVNALSGA